MTKRDKSKSNSGGFSLIETIVAIAVLSIALVGPMTAAQRALLSASYSRDQMKAYYLAEEGIEYIHYIRDKNALENPNDQNRWLQGLSDCVPQGGNDKSCGVDLSVDNVINCNNLNQCILYFDSSTGFYGHTSNIGSETIFIRWIKILDGSNSNEKKVESRVSWKTGPLNSRTITVTGFINNWKEQPY